MDRRKHDTINIRSSAALHWYKQEKESVKHLMVPFFSDAREQVKGEFWLGILRPEIKLL